MLSGEVAVTESILASEILESQTEEVSERVWPMFLVCGVA